MNVSKYFDNIHEFKNKLTHVTQQLKKLKALRNYSEASPLKHFRYVELLQHCVENNFLTSTEENFLEYMIQKYEIDYLDWAHKTPWLKRQIQNLKQAQQAQAIVIEQPSLFDLRPTNHAQWISIDKLNHKPIKHRPLARR